MINQINTLEMLMKCYNALSPDDRASADLYINGTAYNYDPTEAKEPTYHNLGAFDTQIPMLLGEMIRAIKCDISQNSGGRKTSLKRSVISKMLKKNTANTKHENLWFTYVKDNRQYACDGVICYNFSEVDESLPITTRPEHSAEWDKLIEHNVFKTVESCNIELELPSAKMLEAYIKLNKIQYLYYAFGENQPTVDARRLLDLMKVLPNVKLYWNGVITPFLKKDVGAIRVCESPLYGIDDKNNKILLFPIRDGCAEFAGSERTSL